MVQFVSHFRTSPSCDALPLLPTSKPAYPLQQQEQEGHYDGYLGASFSSAVFSLTTSVIGAGIMGLPAAIRNLGIVPGVLMIILISLLTNSAVQMMLKFSAAAKVVSYGGLMADAFGRRGRILLQSSVLVNNLGVLVVYLIITGDVLSGSTTASGVHHSGVLEELAGGSTWWNSKFCIMLVTEVVVLAPLVSFRHIDSLRFSSAVSVALALIFVIVMAAIIILKLIYGNLNPPKFFPNVRSGDSVLELFTVVPVVVTAYTCHHSVHPVLNELKNYSDARGVVHTSLGLCTAIYIAMSVFGYLLFGESAMDDFLSNFDVNLGVPYSDLLCEAARVGYVLHLLLVFPVLNFSLRLNLDGLLFPTAEPLSTDYKRFVLMTTGILGVVFVGAYFVPSIYVAFQFTGATAAVCLGFIFPGLVCLRDLHGVAGKKERLIAWLMVILAICTSIIAISSDIFHHFKSQSVAPTGTVTLHSK